MTRDQLPPRRARLAKLALGVELACEGFAAKTSLIVGALVALGFSLFVARLAARPGESAVAEGIALASSALAWGPGVLLIIAAASHSFVRDRSSGVIALFTVHAGTNATGWRSYVASRTLGLALVLAIVIGGGSIVAALGAIVGAVAANGRELNEGTRLADAARGAAASLVYALGFASVGAAVGTATMGPRKRQRGYSVFVAVLLVSQVIALSAGHDIPAPWRDVITFPGALAALRRAVLLGLALPEQATVADASDATHAAGCALISLAVYISTSAIALRRELGRRNRDRDRDGDRTGPGAIS